MNQNPVGLLAPALLLAVLFTGACDFGVVPRPYPLWDKRDAGVSEEDAGVQADDDAGQQPREEDAGAPGEDAGTNDAGPEGPVEMRGLWITRFAYNNQATLEGILERAAEAGFNAVFVQVRGTGDAYYQSNLEPWARSLAGALGRDPGWDPLAVAIAKGHALGLEVHAYVNALSAWAANLGDVEEAEGDVQHALYANPHWTAVTPSGQNEDTEYVWFAPTPEVAAHTAAVVADLLSRYDVDGVHLDRIRMAGPSYSHDDESERLYDEAKASEPGLSYGEFMQRQVTAVVEAIFDAVIETRPEVTLSAAVWGIYERLPGCSTSQGRADYHQDSMAWLEQGIMDVLVPMIYWPEEEGSCTDFRVLTQGFVEDSAPNKLWAGVHALEIREGYSWQPEKLAGRLTTALDVGAEGSVIFASTYFDDDTTRWDALVGDESEPGPWYEPMDPPGPQMR